MKKILLVDDKVTIGRVLKIYLGKETVDTIGNIGILLYIYALLYSMNIR